MITGTWFRDVQRCFISFTAQWVILLAYGNNAGQDIPLELHVFDLSDNDSAVAYTPPP